MEFGINKITKVFNYIRQGDLLTLLKYISFRFSSSKSVTIRRKGNTRWAYISYIPEALLRTDSSFLGRHQNRREMQAIVEAFLRNRYNVVVQEFDNKGNIPEHDYEIIFGLEPNFVNCAKKYPNAKKIYYATGAYPYFANRNIKLRTDEFNAKYNTNLPYRRLAQEGDFIEISDDILQIGTKNTIESYPESIKPKIALIHQSSNYIHFYNLEEATPNPKKFLWLGSSGSILKGVDLVIELFLQHPEFQVDIVGPVEKEVIDVFAEKIKRCANIRLHGFIDINSPKFHDIIKDTTFLIYPSITEGFPGAVVAAMKIGLIPIVSRIAAPTEIKNLGYALDSVTIGSLERGLNWSQCLSPTQIHTLRLANLEYSQNYTLERFSQEFDDYIQTLS